VTEPRPLKIQFQGHAMGRAEPVDGGTRAFADSSRKRLVGFALGFRHDVRDENFDAILNPVLALAVGVDCANCSKRHRGTAPGSFVALQNDGLNTLVASGEGGGQAAGAGTDDDNGDGELKIGDRTSDYGHGPNYDLSPKVGSKYN